MSAEKPVKPTLCTRETNATGVLLRWYKQYKHSTRQSDHDIARALEKLGPTPDPDKIDAIIGNESWTGCHCSVHGRLRTPVVDFPTDDEYSVALCVECIQDAVRVLRENGIEITENSS